jgi:hypothetical protein
MSSLIGLFGFVDEHTFLTKSGDLSVVFTHAGPSASITPNGDRIARRFEGSRRALVIRKR